MEMNESPDEKNLDLAQESSSHDVPNTTSQHKTKTSNEQNDVDAAGSGGGGHGMASSHPTSYLETLMHLLKGNVGPGLFAMGDGFKNCGILLAPFLTVALGIVCVHSEHILVRMYH
jgi:solute carrier family 36 (proton-coupled amino acid transporter)